MRMRISTCVGREHPPFTNPGNATEKTIEEVKSLANSSYSKAGYAPGNALEKESRTRAMTQLPLTLCTRAFFPTHDNSP